MSDSYILSLLKTRSLWYVIYAASVSANQDSEHANTALIASTLRRCMSICSVPSNRN